MSINLTGTAKVKQTLEGEVQAKEVLTGDLHSKQSLGGAIIPRGNDGISPTVEVTETETGHRVEITDVSGTKAFDLHHGKDGDKGDAFTYEDFTSEQLAALKGKDGVDGYTPQKGIDYFDGYTPVKGVDYFDGQDGYTPVKGVDYFDGQPGKDGYTPQKGKDYFDGADGYTPIKGVDYFDGKDGQPGKDGKDGSNGKDGVSATHSWNGTTLTVTSASGTSSAELKGNDGSRGTGLLAVTTAPSSYTTEVNGLTPAYRIALSTVKSQASVDEVFAGDTIRYSYYHYPIIYVDSSYVYCRARVSIRGATGAEGAAGSDATVTTENITNALGYTPMNPGDYAVSVKVLGAKGDGSTDDTAVFQSALTNNRTVYVPGGTYKLSGELVIGQNCQLELAQDAFLNFTQTSGNCISMKAGSNIVGNHAAVNVPYAFTGKVVNIDAGLDTGGVFGIPPLATGKWGPMWAAARYITDLHIVKLSSGGVARSKDGTCNGTAVYLRANYQDKLNFLWAVDLSKLRIAGGFSYGIHLDCEHDPNEVMNGWIHQTKIDGFIYGCEIGVYCKNSTLSYINVRVVPDWGADNNAKYCKHGILLENSTNVDLSQSRVMDWDSNHTLWEEGGQYQHLALLGDCAGLILSEHYYYSTSSHDIRSLIYTNRPSNLEKLVIIQEPITRWFKGREGTPYFNDGYVEKKLLLQEEFDECFNLERVPDFEDALVKSIGNDGLPFNNGLGYYPYGKRWVIYNGTFADAEYYGCTGLIPIKKGDTIYTDQITWKGTDGNEGAVIFDANFNRINSCTGITASTMTYYFGYEQTDEGFSLKINPVSEFSAAAYIGITFERSQVGDKPLVSVNTPMTFSQHGFLADGVEVKSDNVYGLNTAAKIAAREVLNEAKASGELSTEGKGLFYIEGDSTEAGVWTGSHDKITSYYDGLIIAYKTNVAGVSGGTTLNINGLGGVPVYRNASTAVTTIYPSGSVLILTYSGEAWLIADYDANTKNSAGTSNKTGSKMYLVGATSQTSSGTTTYTNTNTYIGTDNCLYSGGKKVYTADDLTSIVNSVVAALPVYDGEVV